MEPRNAAASDVGADDTSAVLSEFRGRLPLKDTVETKPGLSNARNTAVGMAEGAYLIFTDDDALSYEQWLLTYVAAFLRYPEATIFGGSISPWFGGRPPNWLYRALSHVGDAYAVRELRDEMCETPITTRLVPFGANMAFRTHALRNHPFDPKLGRVGSAMLNGEETAVIESLLASGHSGRWVPGARVQHYIPPARQTTAYLRRYYAGQAATQTLLFADTSAPLLLGKPRWMWREVVVRELVYRFRRLYAQPTAWIPDLKSASAAWGRFRAPQSSSDRSIFHSQVADGDSSA